MSEILNPITDLLRQAEILCGSRSIPLFHGDVSVKGKVEWVHDDDALEFIETGIKCGATHIVTNAYEFVYAQEVATLYSGEAGEEIAGILDGDIQSFREYEGQTCVVQFYWFKEGICYEYSAFAPWYASFLQHYQAISETSEELDIQEISGQSIPLTADDLEQMACDIAQSEQYFTICTRPPMIKAYLGQVLRTRRVSNKQFRKCMDELQDRTRELFESHYRKDLEKEFYRKIEELKVVHPDITKKAIIARLDITEKLYERLMTRIPGNDQ